MNNMNNKFFKGIQLGRVFIIALVGILVLVTTACSPNSPEVSGTGSYHERVGQPQGLHEFTDRADGKSRPDMSSYRDNDARDTTATQAKARDLSRRAERNVQKVQSPQEFVEEYREGTPLPERTRNVTERVGKAAQQFGEDVSEGTQENLRNLRGNAEKAGQNIQEATQEAQRNAREASDIAQERAREAAKTVRDRA